MTLLIVAGLALVAIGYAEARRHVLARRLASIEASGYSDLEGRRVVVHLEDRSIRGVLSRSWADGHTLAHPEWLQGAAPAQLAGEMFCPREKVTMIQAFDQAD